MRWLALAPFLLLLLVSLLVLGSNTSQAHPPSTVSLTYDFEGQSLDVFVSHSVSDPSTHYIYEVKVWKNDVLFDTYSYTTQTGSSFTYTYDVPAVDGDVLKATAYCSISGSGSGTVAAEEPGPPPDTTPPVVVIDSPSDGALVSASPVTLSGSASDETGLQSVEVRVNSGAWSPAQGSSAWTASVSLVEGQNTVEARATDSSGNTGIDSISITLNSPPAQDTQAPIVDINLPADGATVTTSSVTVSGTATDNEDVSKVEVKLENGAWTTAQGTVSWSLKVDLVEGENNITARASDPSGNTGTDTIKVFYSVEEPPDTTPPVIRILSPADGAKISGDEAGEVITVSGTASDNECACKVELRVNGGPWTPTLGLTDWSLQVTLMNGSNTIEARVMDDSANSGTDSITVELVPATPPDTKLPEIVITSPLSAQTFEAGSIVVSGTASDEEGIERIEVRVNNGSWMLAQGKTQWRLPLVLEEGESLIEARAEDSNGNIQVAGITVSFIPPSADLDGVIDEEEYEYMADLFGDGSYVIYWKVKGAVVHFAVEAETSGWVALGFEPTAAMKDADMIIGWVEDDGTAVVLDCFSTGNYGPHPPDTELGGTSDLISFGGSYSGGITTLEFRRELNTGDEYDAVLPEEGEINIIWAYSEEDEFLKLHDAIGKGTLDLSTGEATGGAVAMIWPIHAFFMFSGFVMMAVGTGIAKLGREKDWWFKAHRALGIAGAASAVVGLAIGFIMVQNTTGDHLNTIHSWIGAITMLAIIGVPVLGFLMFKIPEKIEQIKKTHRIIGWICVKLMALAIVFGILVAIVFR